jgi:lipopolysaccharide export system protein LptA
VKPICALLLALPLLLPAAAQEVPDVDAEDFEQADRPLRWIVVGVPFGRPEGASVQPTVNEGEFKEGKRALAFTYVRGKMPVAVLVYNVLIRDLESIDFQASSKRDAKLRCTVTDADGARFSADTDIKAGAWTHAVIRPTDFALNTDSPVKKEKFDPAKLGFNLAFFDVIGVTGGEGENAVFLDNVTITRGPLKVQKGNLALKGKKQRKTISRPTRIEGNVMVSDEAELTVTAGRFVVTGSIIVNGGTLRLRDGAWSVLQQHRYQRKIMAVNGGRIEMENGFLGTVHPITGASAVESAWKLTNVELAGGHFTFQIQDECSLEMDGVKNGGEFIVQNGAEFTVRNCEKVLIWLMCDDEVSADLTLPSTKRVSSWNAPDELERTIKIRDSSAVTWGLIAVSGCRLTFRDSDFLAVGMLYGPEGRDSVKGLKNRQYHSDFTFPSEHHTVKFLKTRIAAWNFYTSGTFELEIRDCLYGESLSFGTSKIRVFDSTCDGTGGYLGAKDGSTTEFTGGKVDCSVLTQDKSTLTLSKTHVTGSVQAANRSKIRLFGTKVDGFVRELDQGRIEKR